MANLPGSPNSDTIVGTSEPDFISALAGNDLVTGAEGDDGLNGNQGDDTLAGGEGNDLVRGGKDSDRIKGDNGNDSLYGDLGNDTAFGDSGDDLLIGGGIEPNFNASGADFLFGGLGLDTLFGLDGNDSLSGEEDGDIVNGNQGNDTISGGDGNDLLRGGQDDDRILGDAGFDTVFGELGNDQLFGNFEDDIINGNQGNDTISGGQGNDIVRGGQDNDLVLGDAGNDLLYGDKGIDTLTGGDGSEIFFLRKGIGGGSLAEADIITDLINDVDKIGLIEGLSFGSLNLFQGTGANAADTIIQDADIGQFLAILKNVDRTKIDAADFVAPGTLTFSSSNYQINEDGTPVTVVTVNRTDGSDTAVSVTVIPTNGTATAPSDYNNTPIVINFAAGETSKTVNIPIVNDVAIEPKETLNLTLTNPTGGAEIGGLSSAIVEIIDNDAPLPKLTILNPTPEVNDFFGDSIATLGNNVIVGAPGDDNNSGTVYLFDGTTGMLLRTFANPTPGFNDNFGSSVAALGDNILVGAPGDFNSGFDAGIAYLFDRNTGAILQTFLNPTKDAVGSFSGDRFGASIAGVGNNVLIGAPGENKDAGAAYLFDGTTGALLQTLRGPQAPNDQYFGYSVAGLGNNPIVGSLEDDIAGAFGAGAVYLYDGATGALLKSFLDPPPVDRYDLFGASVAAVSNNILVGALGYGRQSFEDRGPGAAFLYDSASGVLLKTFANPSPDIYDDFGVAVAAVGNNKVAIGAPGDSSLANGGGAAYLFDSTTGSLLQTFVSPNPTTGRFFGYSLAALGNNLVISAPGFAGDTGGAVYLF